MTNYSEPGRLDVDLWIRDQVVLVHSSSKSALQVSSFVIRIFPGHPLGKFSRGNEQGDLTLRSFHREMLKHRMRRAALKFFIDLREFPGNDHRMVWHTGGDHL